MTVNSKMTALADEIRELSGTTTPKSIDAMTSDVGSANTEVASQAELIAQIATALEGKASNSGGVILPTLDNPAVASDILSGKEAIDGSGNKITGNIATVTQATPAVNIDANGKITASATQSAGYVGAGTKSATKQLTTQAAKTVTPSTSSQTAVAKNVYTTGAVTVAGDANLKAENIKSGVSIFGVSGTHEGGTTEDLTEELTEYTSLNEELEAVIDSLPSAGGSGGDSSSENVGTCTVTITSDYIQGLSLGFKTSANEYIIDVEPAIGESHTVLCGSEMYIIQTGYYEATITGGEILSENWGAGLVYKTPVTANSTATINITTD